MKTIILKTLFILCFLFCCNCTAKISNFNQYQKEIIPTSQNVPNEEDLKSIKPKVVVFDFNVGDNSYAKHSNIGRSLAVNVENYLTNQKTIELIDRKVAEKLKDEIVLSQLKNIEASYNGPQVADYAISGDISKSGYKRGVSGSLKIYEIPSMRVVENFAFSGIADDGKDAINNISPKIKNFFSKKAYILEKKSLNGKAIFKISQGSNDGIDNSMKFNIINKTQSYNSITKNTQVEKRIIATGKVSNIIGPDSSWIVLDKTEYNNQIRLGDVVIFKHNRSFFEKVAHSINNGIKFLINRMQ